MPDGADARVPPAGFHYPPRASVVCPRCGHMSVFPFVAKNDHTVDYAGVCGAADGPGVWCDAVLTVRVTSHLFPV